MAEDQSAAPSLNPFDQLIQRDDSKSPNPFDEIASDTKLNKPEAETSTLGALKRGMLRSAVPAIGSFPAIGYGASVGSLAGPWGALAGGIAGGMLGGAAISKAQEWGLSKLPDTWREAIGMDDRQQRLDEGEHPNASFIGGVVPFLLTMRPGGFSKVKLPENSSALDRIMANPVTARVFGGGIMGGMELGQEAATHEHLDWRNIAIATGFGMVFNKPTRLGERITEIGGRPGREHVSDIRRAMGKPWQEWRVPTIAEAGDAKVAGPGVTEEVFMGTAEQPRSAALTAQDAARTERSMMGEPQGGADIHGIARKSHPELFEHYDRLVAEREEFRNWIKEYNEPRPQSLQEIRERRAELESQYETHIAERGGYTSGPEARRLRAQIRDVTREHDAMSERARAYAEGRAEETTDLAQARKHLMATDSAIRDLLPEVQSAYRRAAEHGNAAMIAPPERAQVAPAAPESAVALPAAPAAAVGEAPQAPSIAAANVGEQPIPTGTGTQVGSIAAPVGPQVPRPAPIEAEKAFISNDVKTQLIKAGRPEAEAEAAGALIAARYEARSAMFGGRLGTAQELYTREAAEIRGVRQPKAPAPEKTVEPAASDLNAPMSREEAVQAINEGAKVAAGPPAARGPRARPEETWSLLEFLASRGGISPAERNISDVHTILGKSNKFIPGFGHLVRQRGMTLDQAREAATEAGYLKGSMYGGESTRINDLLDAIDMESRGTRVYREGFDQAERAVDPARHEHELNQHLDAELEKAGLKPEDIPEPLRNRTIEIMDKERIADPLVAYERAVMEQDEHGVEAGYLERRSEAVPGWDVSDERRSARGAGEATAGEREREGPAGGAAARERGEDVAQPEPKRELAQDVDEYFQRVRPDEGQAQLPGTEPITDAELAQRRTDQPLRPKVEQRPMEEGLFGTSKDQKELFQRDHAEPFYSAVGRAVETSKQTKASPEQWLATIKNSTGVKPEEMKWLGLEDWLKAQDGQVTKEQVADYVRANSIQLKEVVKDDIPFANGTIPNGGATKFQQDTLPGGENYREVLLTLPAREDGRYRLVGKGGGDTIREFANRKEAYEHYKTLPWAEQVGTQIEPLRAQREYKSSHWDEPNVLAHIRMNDRTIDGKRTLFVEEVQSDWHQQGRRKGYGQPEGPPGWGDTAGGTAGGVPDAPFKTTWPELSLKRVLRYAAEHGYEKVAWTPGEVQSARYDLSKQIDHLLYKKNEDGTYRLSAQDKNQRGHLLGEKLTPDQLADHVGKDMAEKITKNEGKDENLGGVGSISQPTDMWRKLSGIDLKVGGEGMLHFYDDILPKAANKIVKKFGAKVETLELPRTPEGNTKQTLDGSHVIDITPELRDAAIDQGFPLFQGARGKISIMEGRKPIITLMKDSNASTFIHETGHEWLEQMIRDASHPEAPDRLRDDMTTVVDWLGAKSPEDIKTRHHEKFARGFEQYLREGVAPSKELAGVFQQFKDWLLRIYETIKGLGKPISDDIREVFDRMLTAEPQHTVIAPEAPGGPTLPDIHAGDATHAEPHAADALADRVQAERERYITEPPERIADEIPKLVAEVEQKQAQGRQQEPGGGGANAPAEAGSGAGGAGQVDRGSAVSEREPAGGGVGEGRGAERPVGGNVEREGGRVSGRPEPGTTDREHPLAARPARLLGPDESPYLDKAGNIRLDTLTDRNDVRQVIIDAAERNEDFIGDRRGVITDGQRHDLAAALGMDFDMLMKRKVGEAFNAEQVEAARLLLLQSATDVSSLMRQAAKSGADADVLAFAEAQNRHQMIQGQVAGLTAEWGRAGRAFRDLKAITGEHQQDVDQFLRSAMGKTLFQMKQEARLGARLQTPEQVSKFMYDANKHSFGRMLTEYWIMAILSGPQTQVTNATSNIVLALQHFGPETALAAGIGRARSALGREGDTVRMGEIGAAFQGLKRGMASSLMATGESVKTGVSTLLPGEKIRQLEVQPGSELAQRARLNESTTMAEVQESLFSFSRGLRDSFIANAELLKSGGETGAPLLSTQYSHLGAIPDIAVKGVNVLPIGTAIRLPGRFLAVADTFSRTTNFSMAKSALAYRTAANEGLTGMALSERIAELQNNFPEHLLEQARNTATDLTLMSKSGKFIAAVNHLANVSIELPGLGEIAPLKFIMPFVNIAGQIINQSIVKRSPLGLLSHELRADLSGANGTVAQDVASARMMMGTAVAMGIGTLAWQGFASGSGPKDPHKAAMWRLAGNQAHSIRIGDLWYDVHQLGPIGMLTGVAADMYEVGRKASAGELAEAAGHFQHALVQNLLDESFMRGPAELVQAVEDPERYGGRYVRNFLSSFVPYSGLLGQTARAIDPYTRRARTVMDALQNKIPWASEDLMPNRDTWGESMARQGAFPARGLSAIYTTEMSRDPVNIAMVNLGIAPAAVEKKIRNVELTPEQYDDYARLAGRMAKQRLDVIVRSPDFQMWPGHTRRDVIQETIKQSREAARNMVMMKFPSVMRDAVDAKMKKLHDEPKGLQ